MFLFQTIYIVYITFNVLGFSNIAMYLARDQHFFIDILFIYSQILILNNRLFLLMLIASSDIIFNFKSEKTEVVYDLN